MTDPIAFKVLGALARLEGKVEALDKAQRERLNSLEVKVNSYEWKRSTAISAITSAALLILSKVLG